jgi:hypothetical protein
MSSFGQLISTLAEIGGNAKVSTALDLSSGATVLSLECNLFRKARCPVETICWFELRKEAVYGYRVEQPWLPVCLVALIIVAAGPGKEGRNGLVYAWTAKMTTSN